MPAAPTRSAGILATGFVVPAVGGAFLLAGLVRLVPAAISIIAVGLGIIACAVAIARMPAQVRSGRRPIAVRFIAGGMAICGISAVAGGGARIIAPDALLSEVPLPAELPLIGLFITVGLYLFGLFFLPGLNATYVGRLRRGLDGAGVGIWVFFSAWLGVFSDAETELRGGSLTGVLLASVAVSAAAVGTLRATQFDPAALICGIGVIVSIVGLTGLVVAHDYFAEPHWIVAAGALLLAGAVITHHGVRAASSTEAPADLADDNGSFARYPLLALPSAGALVAAVYHLVQQRSFDQVSVVVGIVGIVVVALRETLAVTDVRRYARRLAHREEHFRSLVVGSTDVTVVLDGNLMVRWQSPAAARQFGLSDQDVVGRPLLAWVHPDDAEVVAGCLDGAGTGKLTLIEARLRDGFGAWRDTEWSVSDQRSVAAVGALVVHVRDISERKHLERSLHRAAFVDQLTSLSNRHDLRRALAARIEPAVLMVFGLDGMTSVNQVRGHEVGDAVLVEAARRLRAAVSSNDVAARLEGYQFAVLTEGGAVQAQLLATRLLTILAEPYPVSGVESHLSASAGLAEFQPGGAEDAALNHAELARQRARRRGSGGAPQWYDEAMEAVLRRRLRVEQELPGAAARDEFDLVFQPVLELPGRRPVGVEALLRWRHPGLGTLAAAEFLPVAEELGLQDEVGDWILHRACRQLAEWLRDDRGIWLAINVTAAQLASPGFVGALTAAVEAHAIPPTQLALEFGEEGLGGQHGGQLDPNADARAQAVVAHLAELRTLGMRITLDQFGTRATSLSRLRLLPLDLLKLDRQSVSDSAGRTGAIVGAVVNLARQLGIEVAVQGLDSETDVTEAVNAGCRLGQGNLFCGPVVAERLEAYLDTHRSPKF